MTQAITGRVKPRIEIAPGANPAGDPTEWVWESAGKRRADIVITAGRDDEASQVEAGSLNTLMDNRDGNLSPRNILGKWHGLLARGTPLRTVIDRVADPFTRTVASGWGSTPEGFAWSVSNGTAAVNGTAGTWGGTGTGLAMRAVVQDAGSPDVEVTWSVKLPTMPTGANFVSAGLLRHTDASNYLRAHVELTPAGGFAVKIVRTNQGVQTDLVATTAVSGSYTTSTTVWGKARADGPYIMVKVWTGLVSDEPASWAAATLDDQLEGAEAGLFAWRLNSNAGTYTATFGDFYLTNIIWSGNVPEWSPRWPEKSVTDSVVPVAAAGILRRLTQGQSPIRSPLRQQLGALDPFTYFPLEDSSRATQATSTSGTLAIVKGTKFAADDTLPGSNTAAVMDSPLSAQIQFNIASTATPDGFAILWFFKLESLPTLPVDMVFVRATGTMTRWTLTVDGTSVQWSGVDKDGTEIASSGPATWSVDPTKWIAMQLETNVSGGTTTVSLIWNQIGEEIYWSLSDTYSGTSSKPDYFSIIPASDNMAVAHIWAGDNDLPFVDATFRRVFDGYSGELAADRIDRICRENGVPVYILSGYSEPMGQQKPGKLVDILRDCEAADQGILCERGNSLMCIPRVRRYSPDVTLALDWALGHLGEGPEPTDDDQRYRNDWTVSRDDGGTVQVTDLASIERSGTYDDSLTINIADDSRLIDFATWILSQTTADLLRWPRITINLIAHPELIPAWLACRVGSRVIVTNPPAQIAGETIDLIIEGFTETINNYRWDVELACSPAEPWRVGTWDGANSLWDIATCTLDGDHDDSTTTIVFAITGNEQLSSTSAYDLRIAGEIIGIPIGGMGARTGTAGAYSQTATGVTRGKGGYSKALPDGAPVSVVDYGRWGL